MRAFFFVFVSFLTHSAWAGYYLDTPTFFVTVYTDQKSEDKLRECNQKVQIEVARLTGLGLKVIDQYRCYFVQKTDEADAHYAGEINFLR